MKKRKILRENLIEGYGAGFSMSSGGNFSGGMGGTTRGGFGGASNYGGPTTMYVYSIKPLNHTLEQKPTVDTNSQTETIQIGSKISGFPVRSNATPDNEKRISGIVHKIVQSDNGSIKYYIIQDNATQTHIKIDPLTAKLITHEPIEYYNSIDNIPSRRKEKLKAHLKESKIVSESLKEFKQLTIRKDN